MQIRYLIILLIVISSVSCKNDVAEMFNSEQPNILLIIADDMGKDACPGYTEGTVKPNMPHLESLIEDGIICENFWTNPICAPTRASILTGKYGVHTGVLNAESLAAIPQDEKSIQTYLDEETNNTYSHAVIGKWHLADSENGGRNNPNLMGIEYYAGSIQGGVSDYWDWILNINGTNSSSSEYTTEKYTDLAIDWIGEQDKPWFCWLAYNTPHTPFHVPPAGTHSQGNLVDDETVIDNNPEPYFMAMMENMDYEIGRLLESIPSDELNNTIIVFLGDNGTLKSVLQGPYSNQQSKGSLYQGGINTPFIISGAPVNRNNERDYTLFNNTDLFATIASWAGSDVTEINNSINLSEIIDREITNGREYLYTDITLDEDDSSGWAISNGTFKLINWYDGTEALYHLGNDPYESDNLLDSTLSPAAEAAKLALQNEAEAIRS